MVQENLSATLQMFTNSQVLGGLVPGVILGYANIALLRWTLENRTKNKNIRKLVLGAFLFRFILLAIVLYVAYLLLSLRFVLGLAIGVLVHKLFFVATNLSAILFKRNK